MSGHTQGPWKIHGRDIESDAPSSKGRFVAAVYGADEEIGANAALIAAAPDLLALARRVAAPHAANVQLRDDAIALIARAEGREP